MDATLSYIAAIPEFIWSRFTHLLSAPFDTNNRFFLLYLATSVVFAYLVYRQHKRTSNTKFAGPRGFLSFLFPKAVWSSPSAWLDLRYYVINRMFGSLLYAGLLAGMLASAFQFVTGGENVVIAAQTAGTPTWEGFMVAIGYMLIAVGLGDFIAFYIHYLQHKIPILWEFHKVHHSPEVMHPASNFREHPIDNVFYMLGIGATYGVIMGLASNVFGYVPTAPEILGVPILLFVFNIAGYHLRHSHVWLRWPGRWSMIFGSPAHHHVHHSRHPDHLDKNFAFLFPLWDVLFKTYHMPEDDRDVEFGLYGGEEVEYSSVWRLYSLPFVKIYKRLKGETNPYKDAPQPKKPAADTRPT